LRMELLNYYNIDRLIAQLNIPYRLIITVRTPVYMIFVNSTDLSQLKNANYYMLFKKP